VLATAANPENQFPLVMYIAAVRGKVNRLVVADYGSVGLKKNNRLPGICII
jgi:hypothetical protein